MGVIAFRTPQEGLDKINEALGFLNLVYEVAHDKNMGKTIQDLTNQIIKAQEFSEEKKKEILDAQEVLAQAKEHVEDFSRNKRAHQEKVNLDLYEIKKGRDKLEADAKAASDAMRAIDAANKKAAQEATEKLIAANKLNGDALQRHAAADDKEKAISQKEEAHLAAVSEFHRTAAQKIAELESKLSAADANLSEHAKIKERLLAKEKMLDAALKA
jgi:DNA repair exonuclease SbcCD ATPase subunit